MNVAAVFLAAVVLVEAAVIVWLIRPAGGAGAHMAGRNPHADQLRRALSAKRRDLARSPAPWATAKNRHRDGTP